MTPVVAFLVVILGSAGNWRPTAVDQVAALVIVTAGMLDSGAEGVLVAMITSAVSLFLALRALPNILAILAVMVSSLLLLVLMFGGIFLPRPA